jgi:hypothetical protein
MAAVTPHAVGHEALGPLESRYVTIADLPWQPMPWPGIEQKILLQDQETGLTTALIRMAPGSELPDHEHTATEQTYVLEGRLVDDQGAGDRGQLCVAAGRLRPCCACAGGRTDSCVPDGTEPFSVAADVARPTPVALTAAFPMSRVQWMACTLAQSAVGSVGGGVRTPSPDWASGGADGTPALPGTGADATLGAQRGDVRRHGDPWPPVG